MDFPNILGFINFGPAPSSLQVVQILKKWFLEFGTPKFLRCDNGPQFLGSFIELCAENSITIERASPYNPQSNGSAEQNLGILIFFKSAHGGEDFIQQFYIMQNLPRTSEGLSPARLFFQREVRSPMLYTPPCNKDEMAAGLQ